MRLLNTMFALVVVCSAAVLAKPPLVLSDGGPDSQYTPAPTTSADPSETPASVAQDAPAPLIEETPVPAPSVGPYETSAPVAEDVSEPLAEETPAPVIEETSYSAASLDVYEAPAPVAEDASEPLIEEEIPAPVAEETPAADPSNYRALRRQRQVDNNTTADDITTTGTTTTRPSSTTSAGLGSNSSEESGNATATCAANAVCFHDEDCGSTGDKKGRCLGFFNGKCNCNACLNFLTCKDDSACGGLKGACNTTTSRCSCDEGYKANGFAAGMLDAFRELCNVKDCTGENHADACFGLPCNSGRCIC